VAEGPVMNPCVMRMVMTSVMRERARRRECEQRAARYDSE
jgi:hypothetical protein